MFEWDDNKNQSNIAKHGVSFDLAKRIFENPVLTWIDDRVDYGEERSLSVGTVDRVLFLVVVHTTRSKGKIRIISARRANRSERLRYEEKIR